MNREVVYKCCVNDVLVMWLICIYTCTCGGGHQFSNLNSTLLLMVCSHRIAYCKTWERIQDVFSDQYWLSGCIRLIQLDCTVYALAMDYTNRVCFVDTFGLCLSCLWALRDMNTVALYWLNQIIIFMMKYATAALPMLWHAVALLVYNDILLIGVFEDGLGKSACKVI